MAVSFRAIGTSIWDNARRIGVRELALRSTEEVASSFFFLFFPVSFFESFRLF